MQSLSRRSFLGSAAAVTAGFAGLRNFAESLAPSSPTAATAATVADPAAGYGPLLPDPHGVLDLPQGFIYRVLARTGQFMDDGLLFGGQPDGAAAFPGPNGKTVLIVNHELKHDWFSKSPFGLRNERFANVDPAKVYDAGQNQRVPTPCLGGTSTILYDTRTGEVERRFMSLIGTERNCAGGPTPWNSWISCEETNLEIGDTAAAHHGYCFEVPANATGPVDPVPLKAMGRFYHEAIAIDPASGIVYLTEDRQDGCFYRFIPNTPGDLARGGRLQALAFVETPSMDTRNWHKPVTEAEAQKAKSTAAQTAMTVGDVSKHTMPLNRSLPVRWLDLEDVEDNLGDTLRKRAQADGAARFARGEGCWFGRQSVFFACTTGGALKKGQIFRYVPSQFEGTLNESAFPGRIELFLEPNDTDVLNNADNLTIAPWGDLIFCEDAKDENDVVGVTPQGRTYKLAHNALSRSEFAGACFSPDGSTLFVNVQADGLCLAITGPWANRNRDA